MSTIVIHQLLDRIGNLIRNESRAGLAEHGLQPVQLDALYYLSICNRFSDTPKAVTEYLGLTKGTVSQSLKVLENKGYVEKVADPDDKRVTHLVINHQGRKLIEQRYPSRSLLCALEGDKAQSPGLDVDTLQKQLELLLLNAQKENQYKSFGVCKTCSHNQTLDNGSHFCGLTQVPLSSQDVELVCVEHKAS
ncbi:MarR family winged helix-turn-helix transcriptional regulator [Vibrio nigripulchritudo]|uniref:MarR family winged helix-turn-helix transcriptional regulator n=1 Tax=Vibrio nigripulchritudo TaxID=28173 RepID=UPI00248FE2BB|nr:MarR family winged helix-turn-helix transcriptional regulator [Vibrio nigripulchritudo]BDU40805.1 transcriptional regulator [Vibrio nigripulchritudo]BDU46542.1 transcriptional regulator [Vibrio nigripulchritudo]